MSGEPTYRDPTATLDDRVADLLGRMTIEEKTAQLGAIWFSDLLGPDGFDDDRAAEQLADGIGQVTRIGGNTSLPPAESAEVMNRLQRVLVETTRLGIPVVVHEEGVGGYSARSATVFPQAIGLAATFDPALVGEVADVIREQMVAVGARHNLSPVLDVARDPRWGRVEETYGESPELCGVLGTAYVRAMQSGGRTGDLRSGVVCTGKHFLAYGMPVGGRNHAPVQLGSNELREVYAEPFAAAIRDAGLASIMNSYSAVDGIPCASNPAVLTELLRGELGFDGTVVADYWAVTQLRDHHKTAADAADAARQALEAGLDIELPALDLYREIPALVASGRLDVAVVDTAVARVLRQKIQLGLFERPYVDAGAAPAVFDTPAQRQLARRAAAESVVLLANDGVLPLDASRLRRVAVVGPAADDQRLLQGDYHYPAHQEISMVDQGVAFLPTESSGTNRPLPIYTEHVTPLAGLRAALPGVEVDHARGCDVADPDDAELDEAAALAAEADVAVVCVGGRSGLTADATVGEGRDVVSLDLTGAQEGLVRAVAATGTPTVVVVVSGRVHTLTGVVDHAAALVHAWCPGEEGGTGLADVLTGAVDASGRLPVTLVRHVGQVPLHHDQRARAHESAFYGPYVDAPVEPLFAFGHGLSYTTFELGDLEVSAATTADPVVVSCTVTNTGTRPGVAVPQLYRRDRVASTIRPRRELTGFVRVPLAPGEQRRVTWTIHPSKLALRDPSGRWVTEPGAFTFWVLDSSAADGPEATVELRGDPAPTEQRAIVPTTAAVST
jgi:beta-glucosidase